MAADEAYDVIVVGAGNAALCAALSAAEQGASVLVLEKASVEERGGNSLFTAGGFRFCHDGIEDLRQDILDDMTEGEYTSIGNLPPLPEAKFMEDLMRVTEFQADEDLANILIGQSRDAMRWMRNRRRPVQYESTAIPAEEIMIVETLPQIDRARFGSIGFAPWAATRRLRSYRP